MLEHEVLHQDQEPTQRSLIRLVEQKAEEQLGMVVLGVADVLMSRSDLPEHQAVAKAFGIVQIALRNLNAKIRPVTSTEAA